VAFTFFECFPYCIKPEIFPGQLQLQTTTMNSPAPERGDSSPHHARSVTASMNTLSVDVTPPFSYRGLVVYVIVETIKSILIFPRSP
jgi:hypothetical protein